MENITIPFKEYKELLEIKGKYEESKNNKEIVYVPTPYYPVTYPNSLNKVEVTF